MRHHVQENISLDQSSTTLHQAEYKVVIVEVGRDWGTSLEPQLQLCHLEKLHQAEEKVKIGKKRYGNFPSSEICHRHLASNWYRHRYPLCAYTLTTSKVDYLTSFLPCCSAIGQRLPLFLLENLV